ncbi:hypothetical protein DM860_001411 [Cuscuta australis]|uniref:Uncharacterized protein n=1 Tax=Cuscuta australis TaxID=267555 RepID=A0A328ECH6_9ASTE|nr:hypothetical protein DM860_001411 [Cuscuta australis]
MAKGVSSSAKILRRRSSSTESKSARKVKNPLIVCGFFASIPKSTPSNREDPLILRRQCEIQLTWFSLAQSEYVGELPGYKGEMRSLRRIRTLAQELLLLN